MAYVEVVVPTVVAIVVVATVEVKVIVCASFVLVATGTGYFD